MMQDHRKSMLRESPSFSGMGKRFATGLSLLALVTAVFTGCKEKEIPALPEEVAIQPERDTVEFTVKPGDTYGSLIQNLDFRPESIGALMRGIAAHFPVKLYAGQIYRVIGERPGEGGEAELAAFALEDRGGLFRHVVYPLLDANGNVLDTLAYRGDSVAVRIDTVALQGKLETNLYAAVLAQGESPALLDQLTQVFAWDIDFFRDPRVGDSFAALVEKRWREDGVFLGYGKLLCARYANRGQTFEGFRYQQGYFDADGRSLEKLLMKAPLKFSRISSGFTASRLHPVLGIRRPHWGVDYAAPMGTPIYAAGDGVVIQASWSGGFGNCVKIRHNGVFTTYYGHLNGYAKGIRSGIRVRQGDVIGYLGKTGLATGPHLDYRVQKNGTFINPTSLKTDAKQGIDAGEMSDFQLERGRLLAILDGAAPTTPVTASADAGDSENRQAVSGGAATDRI